MNSEPFLLLSRLTRNRELLVHILRKTKRKTVVLNSYQGLFALSKSMRLRGRGERAHAESDAFGSG